ncbi:MAG: helix-hairpin-helix domain-containing protein [Candidatus Omnitrophica bacterium]|nr:helix-hairpin-helix domain-containing protein [Candidatus Omnitrophota bacterium]
MWLTGKERLTLAGLGAVALAGLGVLLCLRPYGPIGPEGQAAALTEASEWAPMLEEARRVDVNTAGVAALERLPGVGPTLAKRIVDHRLAHGRFRTVEELDDVPGIGPKTRETLEGYLTTQ